jgi:hypothetical protein
MCKYVNSRLVQQIELKRRCFESFKWCRLLSTPCIEALAISTMLKEKFIVILTVWRWRSQMRLSILDLSYKHSHCSHSKHSMNEHSRSALKYTKRRVCSRKEMYSTSTEAHTWKMDIDLRFLDGECSVLTCYGTSNNFFGTLLAGQVRKNRLFVCVCVCVCAILLLVFD